MTGNPDAELIVLAAMGMLAFMLTMAYIFRHKFH